MRKYQTAVAFLFAASCVAGSQKPKAEKFLPPVESHGMTISGYGCDKEHVADSRSSTNVSYWTLTVWAQYGKEHKRYWKKTYGTFEVPVKHAVNSSGESAGSGEAIGGYDTESYDLAPMEKACAEWGAQVQSTLKMEPTPVKSPRNNSPTPE